MGFDLIWFWISEICKMGFDRQGFNKDGFNGYNKFGCNKLNGFKKMEKNVQM